MRTVILLSLIALFSCTNINKDKEALLTVAEMSNYTSTSTYDDVMRYVGRLKDEYPELRTISIATSAEGKEIPVMIFGKISRDRPVVYIQANIHAGEVEGKEAVLMLTRDLLKSDPKGILKKMTLLICPIFNPDGNDKISKNNRTNQIGPANGVGVRYNGQHLDLNRDAMKLETPEVRGLVENIFNRWDPDIFVDCHTTNGSFHEEPVTFTWMMNPNGDGNLRNFMRDVMMPKVAETLEKEHGVPNCYYGVFIDRENPEKGWISYASESRYIVNYVGVRNRIGILNENYVYADFKTRVNGCYNFLTSVLEFTAENGKEIKQLIHRADSSMTARFDDPAKTDSFALEYKGYPTPHKMKIKAFEVDVEVDNTGRKHYKKSNRKRTLWVDYIADYYPVRSIAVPKAYLITTPYNKPLLDNLKCHGIKMTTIKKDTLLNVERYRIDSLKPSVRLNQGHYQNNVKGEWIVEQKEFKAGTVVVRTDQTLGNLVCYLLEPEADDGLMKWNFFDRYLSPQWGRGFYPYPVYRWRE